jgi:hypothetical protein
VRFNAGWLVEQRFFIWIHKTTWVVSYVMSYYCPLPGRKACDVIAVSIQLVVDGQCRSFLVLLNNSVVGPMAVESVSVVTCN